MDRNPAPDPLFDLSVPLEDLGLGSASPVGGEAAAAKKPLIVPVLDKPGVYGRSYGIVNRRFPDGRTKVDLRWKIEGTSCWRAQVEGSHKYCYVLESEIIKANGEKVGR